MTVPSRMTRTVTPFIETGSEFDQLVHELFHGESAARVYPVDVREDADHYYIDAELPGFAKEEIEITVEKSVLVLSAGHSAQNVVQRGEYLLSERRHEPVSRRFRLPPTVEDGSVSANLVNGVLTLTLKKREESKPRKITVS